MASPKHSYTPVSNHDESSRDQSAECSEQVSREGSRPPKKRHNVRFTPGGESLDSENKRAAFDLRDDTNPPPRPKPLPRPRLNTAHRRTVSSSSITPADSPEATEDIAESPATALVHKPRPSIMRLPSSDSDESDTSLDLGQGDDKDDEDEEEEDEDAIDKAISQQTAQNRAQRLSRLIGSHSAPGSRYTSPHRLERTAIRSPPPSPPPEGRAMPLDLNDIPLEKLKSKRTRYGIEDESDDEEEKDVKEESTGKQEKRSNRFYSAAARMLGRHTSTSISPPLKGRASPLEWNSGVQTPLYEQDPDHYVPRPKEYREGYLTSLLRLYEHGVRPALARVSRSPEGTAHAAIRRNSGIQTLLGISASRATTPEATTPGPTPGTSPVGTPTSSGTTTPKRQHQKWYYKHPASQSTGALSDLVSSSTVFAQPSSSKQTAKAIRPKPKHRTLSNQALDVITGKKKKGNGGDDAIHIRVHIAETMQRQAYLQKICKALMIYGAPTHRLEGEWCCRIHREECLQVSQSTCVCQLESWK